MSTVLILQNPDEINPVQLDAITALVPKYEIWMTRDPVGEDLSRLKTVEISTGFKPPEELILNGKLKWHHAFSAGMDWMFQYDNYQDLPMILTNSSGIHAIPMSEHTFAMILAHERGLTAFIRSQSERVWQSFPPGSQLQTLADKTMLILGVGAIGTRVAKLAQAHGMKVLGIRRQANKTCEFVDEMFAPDELDEVLPRADFIVSLLPNTPDSRRILGESQFSRMKTGAFIVNLGRGIHIDERAMIAALKSGKLGGAGLDTFETEPLPESSPLWALQNVIISPHCSGFQPDYGYEARRLFISNLERFVAGDTLFNVVDKQLGYSLNH